MERAVLRERYTEIVKQLFDQRINLARNRLKRKRAEIRMRDVTIHIAVAQANVKMAVATETLSDGKSRYPNETLRKGETEKRLAEDIRYNHWLKSEKRVDRSLLRMQANEEVSVAEIKLNESLEVLYASDLRKDEKI